MLKMLSDLVLLELFVTIAIFVMIVLFYVMFPPTIALTVCSGVVTITIGLRDHLQLLRPLPNSERIKAPASDQLNTQLAVREDTAHCIFFLQPQEGIQTTRTYCCAESQP